ncbi:phytohormone-binding protein CSBP-like [Neltuma alba]|uniref:phytohormone-binding protein CSBP-like n=1 Tax=Neltuma alba TaxID=207710 RepID=UPI0010A5494E|nr:phytohormone-binding protein CSBP-like [Prosopis alba]XP_028792275.1 phytohormone-binding protein CSBP-like [Prosopis alba]
MVNEIKAQTEVSVGLEKLWQVLSSPKDFAAIAPEIVPEQIKEMQVIEGDGGVGTVILTTPWSILPGSAGASYKEKLSELDATKHEIAFEYVEGGFMDRGFSYMKTNLQLSAKGENQTEVDVKISYKSYIDEESTDRLTKTAVSSALNFLSGLEKRLSGAAA